MKNNNCEMRKTINVIINTCIKLHIKKLYDKLIHFSMRAKNFTPQNYIIKHNYMLGKYQHSINLTMA